MRFEYGFLHLYGYGGHHTVAYVGVLEVATEEVFERAAHGFFEGAEVCAALCGVLPVDEGIVFFAVLVYVCYGQLYIRPLEMYDRVEGLLLGHVFFQQVVETAARYVSLPVEDYYQAGVQEGVVLEQGYYELVAEDVAAEYVCRGGKTHHSAVSLRGVLYVAFFYKITHRERGALVLAVAVGCDFE